MTIPEVRRELLKVAKLDIMQWAVARWEVEVRDQPLHNVHRRTLDRTWRQIIRKYGGDDEVLIGPSHDELVSRQLDEE